MILSFSVPDNVKYKIILEWYENTDRQERSRAFREILLSYLGKSQHIIESQTTNHISPAQLQKVNISKVEEADVDLDEKLNFIGMRG
jgi:hypothetical protein